MTDLHKLGYSNLPITVIAPVLVNGDIWQGNILWRKEEDGQRREMTALVDWQVNITDLIDDEIS